MIGSTTPFARTLDAEDGSPPIALPPPAMRKGAALRGGFQSLAITYPGSLTARLHAMRRKDTDMIAPNEPTFLLSARQPPRRGPKSDGSKGSVAQDLAASEDLMAEAGRLLEDFTSLESNGSGEGLDLGEAEAFAEDLPLDPATSDLARQAHMRALVRDFHRRQSQASLLVAGCLATACLLTLAGMLLLVSYAKPGPHDDTVPAAKHSTSTFSQRSQRDLGLATSSVALQTANRGDKQEPLFIPALAASEDASLRPSDAPAAPDVIRVQPGRPLALAPLLPRRQARYLLLRGLPEAAQLSAGQRSTSGAWMVKNAKVANLTLLVDAATAADGDYPIDVYSLGGGDIPQARQRLVLRVEANAGAFAAASLATHWPAALLDLALISLSADANAMTIEMAVEPSPLLARARALLGEGDIASARLLLLHLAEQGEGEAAYELARTFDRQVLAELGARGMDGDPTRAEGWYEQASESGNAEAKQRLKILASLGD